MSNFKVGDEVELVTDGGYSTTLVGDKGTIIRSFVHIKELFEIKLHRNNITLSFTEDEIKLVSSPTKLKAGDFVRFSRNIAILNIIKGDDAIIRAVTQGVNNMIYRCEVLKTCNYFNFDEIDLEPIVPRNVQSTAHIAPSPSLGSYTNHVLYIPTWNYSKPQFIGVDPAFTGSNTYSECSHSWKSYFGLNEKYQYCEKCDKKVHNEGM